MRLVLWPSKCIAYGGTGSGACYGTENYARQDIDFFGHDRSIDEIGGVRGVPGFKMLDALADFGVVIRGRDYRIGDILNSG